MFKLFRFYSGRCSSSYSACTRSKWVWKGITWCHFCKWWVLSVSECHNYLSYEREREREREYIYLWVPGILQHFICWCIGLVWGTGASIAYGAVNALMGPRVDKHKTVCANQSKAFIDVWFSSSYHVVYDIYVYFKNIIVSLIELFGFKLFSLVLNKSFSFPFEPFGNAFGLNADINPLQNNSCLPAIFVVWPCYESYLNLMLNWIKLLISNNLSLSHLQRISHDLVNKIFTYLLKYIYIYIYNSSSASFYVSHPFYHSHFLCYLAI